MKQFAVELKRTSYVTVYVDAETKEQAEDKVWNEAEYAAYDDGDADWECAEVYEHMAIQPICTRDLNNGVQEIYRFDNGYGASKVRHDCSYGGCNGLWEIAVIKFTGDGEWDWHITYDTPITTDVIGHLDYTQAQAVLKQIKELT